MSEFDGKYCLMGVKYVAYVVDVEHGSHTIGAVFASRVKRCTARDTTCV